MLVAVTRVDRFAAQTARKRSRSCRSIESFVIFRCCSAAAIRSRLITSSLQNTLGRRVRGSYFWVRDRQ